MLESHGASRILANFHEIIPHWVFVGLFFPEKFIAEHGDRVRAFLRALDKSYTYINNHEMEAREYLPKYTDLKREMCMISALREYGTPIEPMENLLFHRDLLMEHGYLKKKVTLDGILDYSYLPGN
jgi:ABC-type nitrate/sulfonate/bicarbonate transport system substrate-binding protein